MSSVPTANLEVDGVVDTDLPRRAMPSLKQRTIRGSMLVVGGNVSGQVLRLGSNLILTRLLFPGAFGLMLMVQIVVTGMTLLSDFGIYGNIINHRRGSSPDFLNTAWTMQIIRGAGLWLCACILAYPISLFWGHPDLSYLIPVVGLSAVLAGFNSMATALLNRRVQVGRLMLLNQGSQLLSIVAMIVWAWYFRSIWALVLGGLVRPYSYLLMSHWLLPEHRCRLAWDTKAAADIFKYGKWILVSTALTYVSLNFGNIVLPLIISKEVLGVYSVAFALSMAVVDILKRLSRTILFPVYTRLAESGEDRLRRQTLRVRLVLLAVSLPPLWALAIAGKPIVKLLYDPRYAEAGWMVSILAIGAIGLAVSVPAGSILLAKRDSFRHMIVQIVRAVVLVVCVLFGAWGWGLPGILGAVVIARLGEYPVLAWAIRRYNTWLPALDLGAFSASALVVGGGWYVMGY